MDLFCMESLAEVKAGADPTFLNDDRVLTSLLTIEDSFLPRCCDFQQIQQDIKPHMRRIVCEAENSEEQIFPLAVNYLDRFLSLMPTQKNHLQLLGAVCMFLASKVKDSRPLSAETLCMYTDNSISPTELLNWELVVLGKLKWNLGAVTPNDFVELFVRRLPLPEDKVPMVRKHTQIFIDLCVTDDRLAMNPPSMIASGSMGAAICGLQLENEDRRLTRDELTQMLAAMTNAEVECLRECQEQIERILAASLKQCSRASDDDAGSKTREQQQDQSNTPTDVRDVNL
nr:G1/S-specific cyclin-D2-like isoform X2 [Nerophis lumbriciformis]